MWKLIENYLDLNDSNFLKVFIRCNLKSFIYTISELKNVKTNQTQIKQNSYNNLNIKCIKYKYNK